MKDFVDSRQHYRLVCAAHTALLASRRFSSQLLRRVPIPTLEAELVLCISPPPLSRIVTLLCAPPLPRIQRSCDTPKTSFEPAGANPEIAGAALIAHMCAIRPNADKDRRAMTVLDAKGHAPNSEDPKIHNTDNSSSSSSSSSASRQCFSRLRGRDSLSQVDHNQQLVATLIFLDISSTSCCASPCCHPLCASATFRGKRKLFWLLGQPVDRCRWYVGFCCSIE